MKAAIYCRLSEEDKNKQLQTDDSCSIQNQKAMLTEYAEEHGWRIYKIYSDDDYAGADRNRPGFNLLLKDAEDKKFDIILCKTQSRFTRELELVEKYIHGLFPLWGIRFISIVDNADTANKGNKKSRQINGLVNEWYLEDMSENIKSVLTNRRKNGCHIGSFALYGYLKDPNQKGHLIIDEEAAAVVREVFKLYSQGFGKTAIARMLNSRGIPNPSEYKRRKGLRYKGSGMKTGTLWKYFSISSMLKNEIYIGNMVQGKYGSISYKTKQNKPRPKNEWFIVKGTHEPIIDKTLWERVQKLLDQNAKPFGTGKIGLFAKKVRCGGCGYTLRSGIIYGKKQIRYLKCSNRHVSKDACEGSFITVPKLERTVLDELHRLSSKYINPDELAEKINLSNNTENEKRRLAGEIKAAERKAAEYSKALRELYMDKAKGLISEGDFSDMRQSFTEERNRLENITAELENRLTEENKKNGSAGSRCQITEKYLNTDKLNRELIDTFIDSITVYKRKPGEKTASIDIHWNF